MFIMNWVITLGYDFIPIQFAIKLSLGLFLYGWDFLYFIIAQILEEMYPNYVNLDMMETLIHIKEIQNFSYINWNKIFVAYGL